MPELGVRDVDGFLVGAGLDEDRGDLLMTVVRDRIDGLLHGHVVAVTGLVHDDVVADEMPADRRNLLLQGLADQFGHLARAPRDRMGIVILARGNHEISLGGLIAQAFQPVERLRGHVQQRHAFLLSHLLHRGGIIRVAVAVQLPLLEPAAGDRSEEHRRGALRAGPADEGAEVVLVGAESRGIALRIVRLRIVVAELDEHVIPGLQGVVHLVPETPVDETLRAAAVLRVIDHLEGVVHEVLEHHAPAALGIAAREVLFRHGGIAHQVDGREGAGYQPDAGEEEELFHIFSPFT